MPIRRYNDLVAAGSPWAALSAAMLAAMSVGSAAWLRSLSCGGPDLGSRIAPPAEPSRLVRPLNGTDWSVFRGGTATRAGGEGLSGRFRLAGTYIASGGQAPETRRAVLDDTRQRSQSVVCEGDRLADGSSVLRILHDRVVLGRDTGEETLWLTFMGSGGRTAPSDGQAPVSAASPQDLPSPDRFGGVRTGETRWTFRRESLEAYYNELLGQPERLVSVFDTMKPIYGENGSIEGYRVGIEGEKDFFGSVGLKQDDVVRSVNSVPMTNRRRAEAMIRQFAEGRASAYVFEIERGGAAQKLVYEIR
jgi:type II secretory pathway component PulC